MKSPHLIDFSLKIDDLFHYLCCLISNKREGVSEKLQLYWLVVLMPVTGTAGQGFWDYCLPVQYLCLYNQIPHISVPLAALFYFCSPPYYLCVTHHTFIEYQILYWKMCLSLNFVNRNLNLIMIGDMNFKF